MIAFSTDKQELFNRIIHHFLEIEVFGYEDGVDDIIDVLPEHLYREQPKKCKQVFKELYKWSDSSDKFERDMTAFHEVALYYFLSYMADLQSDDENFNKLYFEQKTTKLIKKAAREDYQSFKEMSLQEHIDSYYDIYYYSDYIFEDTDFLELDNLYNELSIGSTTIADRLGININYYFELLPMDIQNKYKSTQINLTGEISGFLKFTEDRINHGSLSKMFWSNDKPVNCKRLQLIFDNLIGTYYHNHDIDILWNSKVQNNAIDFNIYKARNEEDKYLIQFKRAGSYLKKGYEKKLIDDSFLYKNAFYVILCFTNTEYEETISFIREFVYTETITLYVNVTVLDMRPKNTASKIKGGNKNE